MWEEGVDLLGRRRREPHILNVGLVDLSHARGITGAAWGKWLTRLWVRNQTHDGAKMAAPAYRVPIEPVAAGSHVFNDPVRRHLDRPTPSTLNLFCNLCGLSIFELTIHL